MIAATYRPTYASSQVGTPPSDPVFQQRENELQAAQQIVQTVNKARYLVQRMFQQGGNQSILKPAGATSEGRSINGGTPQDGLDQPNPVPTSAGGSLSQIQTQQLNKEGVEPIQTRTEAQPGEQRNLSDYERLVSLMSQAISLLNGQMTPGASMQMALLQKQAAISAANNEYYKGLASVIGNAVGGVMDAVGGIGSLLLTAHSNNMANRASTDEEEENSSVNNKKTDPETDSNKMFDHIDAETKKTTSEITQKNLDKQRAQSEAQKKEQQRQDSEIAHDEAKRTEKLHSKKLQKAKIEEQENQPSIPPTGEEVPPTEALKKPEKKKEKKKGVEERIDWDGLNATRIAASSLAKASGDGASLGYGYDASVDHANSNMDDTISRALDSSQQLALKLTDEFAQAQKALLEGNSQTWVRITGGG